MVIDWAKCHHSIILLDSCIGPLRTNVHEIRLQLSIGKEVKHIAAKHCAFNKDVRVRLMRSKLQCEQCLFFVCYQTLLAL